MEDCKQSLTLVGLSFRARVRAHRTDNGTAHPMRITKSNLSHLTNDPHAHFYLSLDGRREGTYY